MAVTTSRSATGADEDVGRGVAAVRIGAAAFRPPPGIGHAGPRRRRRCAHRILGDPARGHRQARHRQQGALQAALDRVAPAAGHRGRIALLDSVARLAAEGVIDATKVDALYARRGTVPVAGEIASFRPSRSTMRPAWRRSSGMRCAGPRLSPC